MRPHAVRSPTRLNVRHHFALKPCQVSIHGEHNKKQQRYFHNRDDYPRVGIQESVHEVTSVSAASGSDSIMVQNLPKVPLVNKVSCAERINPTGTSYGAWPILLKPRCVGSAAPSNNAPVCTL